MRANVCGVYYVCIVFVNFYLFRYTRARACTISALIMENGNYTRETLTVQITKCTKYLFCMGPELISIHKKKCQRASIQYSLNDKISFSSIKTILFTVLPRLEPSDQFSEAIEVYADESARQLRSLIFFAIIYNNKKKCIRYITAKLCI